MLRWSAQIISWIATALAARLLAPGDYGIMAMAMLAVGLVPPVLLMQLRNRTDPSMSEAIQKALGR